MSLEYLKIFDAHCTGTGTGTGAHQLDKFIIYLFIVVWFIGEAYLVMFAPYPRRRQPCVCVITFMLEKSSSAVCTVYACAMCTEPSSQGIIKWWHKLNECVIVKFLERRVSRQAKPNHAMPHALCQVECVECGSTRCYFLLSRLSFASRSSHFSAAKICHACCSAPLMFGSHSFVYVHKIGMSVQFGLCAWRSYS